MQVDENFLLLCGKGKKRILIRSINMRKKKSNIKKALYMINLYLAEIVIKSTCFTNNLSERVQTRVGLHS